MNYYSSTTEPVSTKNDVKFESNKTHHLIVVTWEHCYKETVDIKLTNSPLTIQASSYDGINYHSLEFSLTLNYEIVSLSSVYFDVNATGFRIHIPKKDMQLRKKETISLPHKK